MLETALNYLRKKASIIPVGRDKKPLIDWKRFQTEYATEDEVRDWFKKWPEANIGIVTGKISDLIVVDVEKGGDISKFPETDTVETGGGGWHLYYRYTPFENKTRIFPLTDIRGDGGFVVGPPSLHASGKTYKITKQIGRKEFPKELFEGVVKVKGQWNTELLQGVGEGSRNETAAKVIGKILSLFPTNEWHLAWDFAKTWNSQNKPQLPEFELKAVFKSIMKRELSKNPNKEIMKEIVADSPKVTMTEVLRLAEQELLNTKPDDFVSFGYKWLDDVMTGMFRGELVVVGGESGVGKTSFTTNIIYKNSKKHKCFVFALEDRLVDYGIKALYFEIGKIRKAKGMKNYPWNNYRKNEINDNEFIKTISQAKVNLSNDNIEFYMADDLMTVETLEAVLEKKVSEGVDLFLIDHLHYFNLLKGDSSKADYIEQVMVKMKTIQNKTGARIILVVHYRKLNGQKPTLDAFKDSISIVQNANYVINIWRDRSQSAKALDQDFPTRKVETEFYIPKARNPNGEATLKVWYDKDDNDYELIEQSYGTPKEGEVKNTEMKF